MFEVTRVENYTNKTIDELGVMSEDEFIEFSKKYIGNGNDWGVIFSNEKEMYEDIEFIKTDGEEFWSEAKHTSIMIKYIKEDKE